MTINDIKRTGFLRVDGSFSQFFLFVALEATDKCECDACGKFASRGYITYFLETDTGKMHHTGSWSCSHQCCVSNASAFLG